MGAQYDRMMDAAEAATPTSFHDELMKFLKLPSDPHPSLIAENEAFSRIAKRIDTTEQRVAVLESENRTLKAEIAALKEQNFQNKLAGAFNGTRTGTMT